LKKTLMLKMTSTAGLNLINQDGSGHPDF